MPTCRFACPTLSIITPANMPAEGGTEPSQEVSTILLPNADRDLPGGKHPDGSCARRHYGGIAVIDTEACVIRFQTDLFRHVVQIIDDDAADSACLVDPTLSTIPDLRSMVSDGASADLRVREGEELEGRVAATITLSGGTLGTWSESLTTVMYSYPTAGGGELTPAPMASYLEWTPQGSMRIRVSEVDGRGWTEIALSGDETVLIYNWDVKHPRLADFHPVAPPSHAAGVVIVDTDFKWLYELLMPPRDDWSAWLKGVKSNGLPAPELRCDAETADRMRALIQEFEESLSGRPMLHGYLLSPSTGEACGCSRWVH